MGGARSSAPASPPSARCAVSDTLELPFGGATYEPEVDGPRLSHQLRRVQMLMADGRWRTLREMAEVLGHPEASLSARLRDLRKPAFGGCTVERRRRGEPANGLFEYRVMEGPCEISVRP